MSKTYTTVQGDMWDKIAFDQLGDTKYTDVLMRENPKHRDVFVFSSGIVLTIPDIEETVTGDDLPPWKKVSG